MEFVTQNGQKNVKITAAPFKDAISLKKAVLKGLDNAPNLGIDTSFSTVDLINIIGKAIISIDTSDEFERAVMRCLETCIYDGKYKITPQLFDDIPETREDYYEILTKCCEVNLRPFFKSLLSELKIRFPQAELSIPKQNVQQSLT